MSKILDVLKNLGWLATALITVIGGLWVAATYFNDQRLAYSKSFSDHQLEIAYKVAENVGRLVAAPTPELWETEKSTFWAYYHGELVLFETDETATVMSELGRELDRTNFEQRRKLGPYALHVSNSLRKFIAARNENDWRMTFDKLTGL